jgi:prepilin-type N-terminal cleavage/methylation domain-containing protein/prepilin-type processing-associated H-X9-DG protein
MNARKGFTLAELLVTLSIISLLTVILVPSMTEVATMARITLCQNHLKRISEVSQTWAAKNGTWDQFSLAESWTSAVITYASPDVLLCPEGDEACLAEGEPVEDQIQIKKGSMYFPLVVGVQLYKFSDEQWKTLTGEGRKIREPVVYDGRNPDVYWWGMDDSPMGSGDDDFQDMAIRVTKNGDGTATVWVQSCTSGKPEIAWTKDGTLVPNGEWYYHNEHHYRNNNPQSKGDHIEFTLGVGGASHYAMNKAQLDMRENGKIQALDYLCSIAKSHEDNWNDAKWDPDDDGRPDFLRHRGRLNVLFTGGAVKIQWRQDVDPENVHTERALWQPGSVAR